MVILAVNSAFFFKVFFAVGFIVLLIVYRIIKNRPDKLTKLQKELEIKTLQNSIDNIDRATEFELHQGINIILREQEELNGQKLTNKERDMMLNEALRAAQLKNYTDELELRTRIKQMMDTDKKPDFDL